MRAEKKLIVEELQKQVTASPYVLMTDYTGLTVQQFGELRKRLRAVKAEYHVIKNTMLRHAAKAAGLGEFNGTLTGMTAIVIGQDKADIGAAAKIIKARPSSVKGQFVQSCTLSSTMSPPVRVDIREFLAAA